MRKLTYSDDNGFMLDGINVTPLQLSQQSEPVYAYGVVEPIAEAIQEGANELIPMLEAGMIRDLRVASMLYVDAVGSNTIPTGGIDELVWLVNKVGPEVLSTTFRGMISVRICQLNGVPVSMRHIDVTIDNLLKVGADLINEIEKYDSDPWMINDATGEVRVDGHGLPQLNLKRAIANCIKHIKLRVGSDVVIDMSISAMADMYKDVEYINLISRYRALRRDVKRMVAVREETDGTARLYFEKVGIDGCHLAFFRNPNIEERATRQAIQSKTPFLIVDFNSLDLEIAKRLAARNGFPRAWHEFTSVEQLGRVSAPGIKAPARRRKLGHDIVKAYVTHESPIAFSSRFYGFKNAAKKLQVASNILLNAEPGMNDPWLSDVKARLAKNLLMSRENVDKLGDVGDISVVMRRGDDPLSGLKDERKHEIWTLMAEYCGDPELRARLLERRPGADLHAMVFAECAATWNWRVLAGCSRPTAGRWALYGTLEDVMRETAWICVKKGGKPMAYHGMELLIESIDILGALGAAREAQERVLGAIWDEPTVRVARTWK
jgi:hypothetical protein